MNPMMIKRIFAATNQRSQRPCITCKHFRRHDTLSDNFGFCAKSIKVNQVDGSITYMYATTMRVFECKGQWWESNKPDDSMHQQV